MANGFRCGDSRSTGSLEHSGASVVDGRSTGVPLEAARALRGPRADHGLDGLDRAALPGELATFVAIVTLSSLFPFALVVATLSEVVNFACSRQPDDGAMSDLLLGEREPGFSDPPVSLLV